MRGRIVAVALVAGLAVASVAFAEGPLLKGTVGGEDGIKMRDASGTIVSSVAPGAVSFELDDQSDAHNFHLTGPGVNIATGVEAIETKTFDATLVDGVYRFQCDIHPLSLKGQFTAGTGGSEGGGGGGGGGGGTTTLPSAPVGSTLVLTSGPGLTISLKTKAGKKVTRLKPGRYTIVARDKSGLHSAHILGAGVNKKTAIPGTATQTWKVVLKNGTLVYQCDAHKATMRGTVKIAA